MVPDECGMAEPVVTWFRGLKGTGSVPTTINLRSTYIWKWALCTLYRGKLPFEINGKYLLPQWDTLGLLHTKLSGKEDIKRNSVQWIQDFAWVHSGWTKTRIVPDKWFWCEYIFSYNTLIATCAMYSYVPLIAGRFFFCDWHSNLPSMWTEGHL